MINAEIVADTLLIAGWHFICVPAVSERGDRKENEGVGVKRKNVETQANPPCILGA